MNTKLRNSMIGATVLLLASSQAWALGIFPPGGGGGPCYQDCPKAPEIDAASGTSAIALVSGILLLMRERVRAQRKAKSDDHQE